LGLPKPIIKSHPKEKWAWPWARGAPQNWVFPFNISARLKNSDFKIARLVGFAKAIIKSHPEEKENVVLG